MASVGMVISAKFDEPMTWASAQSYAAPKQQYPAVWNAACGRLPPVQLLPF
jgi:hypothetical protein